VGSGSGGGELQQSWAAAGTRQTTSHAPTNAAAKVTPAAVVVARVEADASRAGEDTAIVEGGGYGGCRFGRLETYSPFGDAATGRRRPRGVGDGDKGKQRWLEGRARGATPAPGPRGLSGQ